MSSCGGKRTVKIRQALNFEVDEKNREAEKNVKVKSRLNKNISLTKNVSDRRKWWKRVYFNETNQEMKPGQLVSGKILDYKIESIYCIYFIILSTMQTNSNCTKHKIASFEV